MSPSKVTLREVVSTLQAENLLSEDDAALRYLSNRTSRQPWYIRTMVGFGAWLASLLLIGFVAGFSLAMESGYTVIGLVLIVGAILVRRQFDNDFLNQCALAVSLAGQALLAYGLAETLGHDEFETYLSVALIVSSVLFFLFPDRIHRVIMVLIATGSLTTLFYLWEANSLVPLLGPAFTGALVLLHRQTPNLVASRFAQFVRPLMNGLVLSAFGVLLISTVYILPELGVDFEFYPRPWISTILFGTLFLYVGGQVTQTVVNTDNVAALPVLYGVMIAIIACSWVAPGLLLGLIVTTLGAASGNKTFIGAGVGFFAIFLATYFYGIEVTMLTKSITLVAAGVAILVLRWTILKVFNIPGQQGMGHA
jgi:MFS family permease